MAGMADKDLALSMVKARLNRLESDTSLDEYLWARISAAEAQLIGIGITDLWEDEGDLLLVTDLAVWQYQNRDAAGSMPDWLRLRRRERWLRRAGSA